MNRGGFLINVKSTHLLRTAILVSFTYKIQVWPSNSGENDVIRSITITYLQHIVAVECQQSFCLKIQTLNNHEQYSCIPCSSQTFSVTVGLFTMELSILTCWISNSLYPVCSYFLCYTVYIFLEMPPLNLSGSTLRKYTLNFENCYSK